MSAYHCPLCPLIFQHRSEAEWHLREEHRSRVDEEAGLRTELAAAAAPLDWERLRILRASPGRPSVTLLFRWLHQRQQQTVAELGQADQHNQLAWGLEAAWTRCIPARSTGCGWSTIMPSPAAFSREAWECRRPSILPNLVLSMISSTPSLQNPPNSASLSTCWTEAPSTAPNCLRPESRSRHRRRPSAAPCCWQRPEHARPPGLPANRRRPRRLPTINT